MPTLTHLVNRAHARAVVAELTRDPDPAPNHLYVPDPQSGAGACTCGVSESHRRHLHAPRQTATRPDLCVCGLPVAGARCHT